MDVVGSSTSIVQILTIIDMVVCVHVLPCLKYESLENLDNVLLLNFASGVHNCFVTFYNFTEAFQSS